MAIDLPPAVPPALMTTRELSELQMQQPLDQEIISTEVAGYGVSVYGNRHLSPDAVISALKKGNSLHEALWQLNQAYSSAGHSLTRLRYALKSTDLHVLVIDGKIRDVVAPNDMENFFWDVEGRSFDLHGFEIKRLLANIAAERQGLNVESRFVAEAPDSPWYNLYIDTTNDPDYKPLRLEARIGNPGNRFVGRNYLQGSAAYFHQPVQWKISANRSLDALDTDQRGKLQGFELTANNLIPIGYVAAGISSTEYNYELGNSNLFDGEIQQAQLLFQHIAHSESSKRIVFNERLLFVNNKVANRRTGETGLDERYFAAQFAVEYSSNMTLWDYPSQFKSEWLLSKGLSDNEGTLGSRRDGFKRDARFLTLNPNISLTQALPKQWKLVSKFESQFSDRQVPEQQQWVLGGQDKLRAWLPGAFIGDEGHYLSVSVNAPAKDITRNIELDSGFFIEAGQSHFKGDPLPSQSAVDAGISLSLKYRKTLEFNFISAAVLLEKNDQLFLGNEQEADFYFTIRKSW